MMNRFVASEEPDLTIESVSNPADPSMKMEAGNKIFHVIMRLISNLSFLFLKLDLQPGVNSKK